MDCNGNRLQSQAPKPTPGFVHTAVGDVNFHGAPCPWDRESVRALVDLITNGDDDCQELIDLADATGFPSRAEWSGVAGELVTMAARVAEGNGSRVPFVRLCEILAPHERGNACPACGVIVGGESLLRLHYHKHPACRAAAVLAESIHRTRFAICPVCRFALQEVDMVWANRWGWVHRDGCAMAAGDRDAEEEAGEEDRAQDGAGRDCRAATETISDLTDSLDKEARR